MAIQQLPSGRYRATVKHPETGKRVSAAKILGDDADTYRTKTEARTACDAALTKIRERIAADKSPTLQAWADTWTTDPLYQRPKESTNIHNAERIKAFVAAYGHRHLAEIGDEVAAEWIQGGKNLGSVKVLCTMFNDAMSRKAGRLTATNPFAKMGIGKGHGRKHQDPPTEAKVWEMIGAARQLRNPAFAAWLQTACFTGMRPGELDALKWDDVDFDAGWLRVHEQYNVKSKTFTTPKNGQARKVLLTDEARDALKSVKGNHPVYCFTNLRNKHWTPGARAYWWKAVCAKVGWTDTLYLATRHFAGWLMYEVMQQDAEDVGHALGHTGRDVGKLVREVYGHRTADAAMERIREAHRNRTRGDGLSEVA
jgi:integrase